MHNYRIHGLAYCSDDPGECPLYVLHRLRDAENMSLSKLDPDAQDVEVVHVADFHDPLSKDLEDVCITNQWDRFGGIVLKSISNNPADEGGDQIAIYQLEPNIFFYNFEPVEGVVHAGEEQQINMNFATVSEDGVELDVGLYAGSLIIDHNAAGERTVVPINIEVFDPGAADSENERGIPETFEISEVYPNPFNSVVRMNFNIPRASYGRLNVYNLSGRLIDCILAGELAAGKYSSSFDGNGLPSGLYIVRLETGWATHSKKAMLLR